VSSGSYSGADAQGDCESWCDIDSEGADWECTENVNTVYQCTIEGSASGSYNSQSACDSGCAESAIIPATPSAEYPDLCSGDNSIIETTCGLSGMETNTYECPEGSTCTLNDNGEGACSLPSGGAGVGISCTRTDGSIVPARSRFNEMFCPLSGGDPVSQFSTGDSCDEDYQEATTTQMDSQFDCSLFCTH